MTDTNDNNEEIKLPNSLTPPGVPQDKTLHMTPEELRKAQEELVNYRTALDQEFAEAAEKATTSEAVLESTLDYFKKSMAETGAHIVWLSQNSTSDGVRLNACKYMIECVRKGVADSHVDPVNEILESIFKNNDKPARETDTSDLVHEEREGEH